MMWLLGILFVLCVGGVAGGPESGALTVSYPEIRGNQYPLFLSGTQLKRILDAAPEIEECENSKKFLNFVDVTIILSSESKRSKVDTNLYCKPVGEAKSGVAITLTWEVDRNGKPEKSYFQKTKNLRTGAVSYSVNNRTEIEDGDIFETVGGFELPQSPESLFLSDKQTIVFEAYEKTYLRASVATFLLNYNKNSSSLNRKHVLLGIEAPGPLIISCGSREKECEFNDRPNNKARSVNSLTQTPVSDSTEVSSTSSDNYYHRIYKEPSYTHTVTEIFISLQSLLDDFQSFWDGMKNVFISIGTAGTGIVALEERAIINFKKNSPLSLTSGPKNKRYMTVGGDLVHRDDSYRYTPKLYFTEDLLFYTDQDTKRMTSIDAVGVKTCSAQKIKEKFTGPIVQYVRLESIEIFLRDHFSSINPKLKKEENIVTLRLIYMRHSLKFFLEIVYNRDKSAFWAEDLYALTVYPKDGFTIASKIYYPFACFLAPSFKAIFGQLGEQNSGDLIHAVRLKRYDKATEIDDYEIVSVDYENIVEEMPKVTWELKLHRTTKPNVK